VLTGTRRTSLKGEVYLYINDGNGRGVTVREGHWGYSVLVVEDLDGNQLFFNYPNEPGQDPEGLRRT